MRKPRIILSTIYGADGEVIYEGDHPAEARRIWSKLLVAAFPEQFNGAKNKRPRFGDLFR